VRAVDACFFFFWMFTRETQAKLGTTTHQGYKGYKGFTAGNLPEPAAKHASSLQPTTHVT
jgi:hypothetical protein